MLTHHRHAGNWFQAFDAAGDIKPTKSGVSLRFNEWSDLCGLISSIAGIKMIPFASYKAPQTQSRLPSHTKK